VAPALCGAGTSLLNSQFRYERRALTTSDIGGRVGPTSNDAGDQSQREGQIADPLASLVAHDADRGPVLVAPGPSRNLELAPGTACATATAPAAALRSPLWAAPLPDRALLPSTRRRGLGDSDNPLFNLSYWGTRSVRLMQPCYPVPQRDPTQIRMRSVATDPAIEMLSAELRRMRPSTSLLIGKGPTQLSGLTTTAE
jgi:hypothetical protein